MLKLLLLISMRYVRARRVTWVIGGLVFVGTLFLVVGGSVLSTVDRSMRSSLTETLCGDIQVFSSQSKDELELFSTSGSEPDLAPLDFPKVKAALLQVENVKDVVPMLFGEATFEGGNFTDVIFARLRDVLRAGPEAARTPEGAAAKAHARRVTEILAEDLRKEQALLDAAWLAEDLRVLEHATSEAFWSAFDADPLAAVEYLENKVAPLATGDLSVGMPLGGFPLAAFARAFPRFELVKGELPANGRGLMIAEYVYEERFKLKAARRLDKLLEAFREGRSLGSDPELQRWIGQNKTQLREILFQVGPHAVQTAEERLRKELGRTDGELRSLLEAFFDVNDQNIVARHQAFYAQLAPLLELYRVRLGDVVTLRKNSRGGYARGVNVPLAGIFRFRGLEKAALSRELNVIDIGSYRELHGYPTAEEEAEFAQMANAMGITHVERAGAEERLFSGSVEADASTVVRQIDEDVKVVRDVQPRASSEEESERGMVTNAAVTLVDPDRAEETLERIRALPGTELKAISWKKAAGFLGQFTQLAQVFLGFAVAVIFLVMAIIVNNATMIVILQRVREVGTMRAIGSRRAVVFALVLLEGGVVGLFFGALGLAAGAAIVSALGNAGIPAGDPMLYFFFSGPSLHPQLSAGNLIGPLLAVVLVNVLAVLYPATLAMKVPPAVAMQSED